MAVLALISPWLGLLSSRLRSDSTETLLYRSSGKDLEFHFKRWRYRNCLKIRWRKLQSASIEESNRMKSEEWARTASTLSHAASAGEWWFDLTTFDFTTNPPILRYISGHLLHAINAINESNGWLKEWEIAADWQLIESISILAIIPRRARANWWIVRRHRSPSIVVIDRRKSCENRHAPYLSSEWGVSALGMLFRDIETWRGTRHIEAQRGCFGEQKGEMKGLSSGECLRL